MADERRAPGQSYGGGDGQRGPRRDSGDRGRPGSDGGSRPRGRFGGGRPGGRRKVCNFCMDAIGEVDYKDMQQLRRHVSERGKIEPRRKTGTCARHQRSLTTAIKRARHVALLPFVSSSGKP